MKKLPCKDCIVFPVCRSQIKNMRKRFEVTELCEKCSIITSKYGKII